MPKAPLTAAVDEIARVVLVDELKDRGFRKKRWTWTFNYMSEAIAEPAIVIDLYRTALGSQSGRFGLSLWCGWVGSLAGQSVGYEMLSSTFLSDLAIGSTSREYPVNLGEPRALEELEVELRSDWSDYAAPWLAAVHDGPDELLAYYRSLLHYNDDTTALASALRADMTPYFDEWITSRLTVLSTAAPEAWHACVYSVGDALDLATEHGVAVSVEDDIRDSLRRLVDRMRSPHVAPPPLITRRVPELSDTDLVWAVDLRDSLPHLASKVGLDLDGLDCFYRPGYGFTDLTRAEVQAVAAPWRSAMPSA